MGGLGLKCRNMEGLKVVKLSPYDLGRVGTSAFGTRYQMCTFTLRFFDGRPPRESKKSIYEEVDWMLSVS